jgi:hypothetical protein
VADNEEFAEVYIETTGLGIKNVMLNGEEVSDRVRAASIHLAQGEVPRIILEQHTKGGKFKGPGIVYTQATEIPMSTIIRSLDPAVIEQEALSRQGWGEDKTYTEIVLGVIGEQCDAIES